MGGWVGRSVGRGVVGPVYVCLLTVEQLARDAQKVEREFLDGDPEAGAVDDCCVRFGGGEIQRGAIKPKSTVKSYATPHAHAP